MTNGTLSYTRTVVDINFTGDEVACRYCPLLETYSRNQCRRTGEYILDIKTTGKWCPLQIIEEERTEDT